MTRRSRPAQPADKPGVRPGQPAPAPNPTPKPTRTPAHLPGQPGKGGFDKNVKPIPLPGKHRGR